MVVDDLYVKPEFRNQGIATQLIRHLEVIAKAYGCVQMEGIAFKWNVRANELYSKIAPKTAFNEQFYQWTIKF